MYLNKIISKKNQLCWVNFHFQLEYHWFLRYLYLQSYTYWEVLHRIEKKIIVWIICLWSLNNEIEDRLSSICNLNQYELKAPLFKNDIHFWITVFLFPGSNISLDWGMPVFSYVPSDQKMVKTNRTYTSSSS